MSRYTWCGIYVGQGASPVPADWHAHTFPSYRGETCTDALHGELDADRACFLARVAGCARGSVIYLDLVEGTTIDYVDAWLYVVELFGYRAGIRCTGVEALPIDPTEWLFKACAARAETFDEEITQPWMH